MTELVVKIDEDTLKRYQGSVDCEERAIIVHSTPLPKGHGDLIDVSNLLTVTDIREDGSEFTYVPYSEIEDAPIIIEADKESKSKELYTKVKDTSENHYYKENNNNSYPRYLCNKNGSVCR